MSLKIKVFADDNVTKLYIAGYLVAEIDTSAANTLPEISALMSNAGYNEVIVEKLIDNTVAYKSFMTPIAL